jgi:hypothetical protein
VLDKVLDGLRVLLLLTRLLWATASGTMGLMMRARSSAVAIVFVGGSGRCGCYQGTQKPVVG